MSFDTRRGTRGNRQPAGRMLRWVNRIAANRIRRRGSGSRMGFDVLILITGGRRSGEERVNPVSRFSTEDGRWLIVASANGAVGNPAWYYNLAAHPDRARIEVDGATVAVTTEQLHGSERSLAWQQIIAAAPRF